MIIEIAGGLTSRLDVLASILATKHYPDLVQIVWEPDKGVNARFENLFENDIQIIKKSDIDLSKYRVKKYEWTCLDPRLEPSKDLYFIADYPVSFEDTEKYGRFDAHTKEHVFNQYIKDLVPIQEITDSLKEKQEYINKFEIYGINIRRGTGLNYHPNSCIMSPNSLFRSKIKRILEEKNNVKFIITTDSYIDLEQLCMNYYDKLIFVEYYMRYPLDDGYTLEGMKRTLIDWYLLQKSKKIFCSKEAGFAMRCGRTFNIPVEELISQNNKRINYHGQAMNRKLDGRF